MSNVSFTSEISGLSFVSTFLSPLLFFYLHLLLFPSCLFPLLMAHSPDFERKKKIHQYVSSRNMLFCMTLVSQLGQIRWSVVCATCCLRALVAAVMHLHN